MEAYYKSHGKYPAATAVSELKAMFVPNYAKTLEDTDAWGTPFKYLPAADLQDYRLVSAGSDKKFDEKSWTKPGVFTDSKEDAVLSGTFVRKWAIAFR